MNRPLTPNEQLLQLATSYIGLTEIVGVENNPVIVQMFDDIGFNWVKDDETAWCSMIMNWLAWKCGLEHSGKLDGRSWLDVGKKVSDPEPGDVVIFWRESINSWKGHVGIFLGYTKDDRIFCLGGNQHNEFNYMIYPGYRILGFRRLRSIPVNIN